MMGQELTKRLHAKTDWPSLYACGDSTTLGMGTPAVVASGFGAANVILRERGMEEYASKKFEREYVRYVKENPKLEVPKEIDSKPANASIIARECQHCEGRQCRLGCPAGIDIAGFIRRIEARNYSGAARLVRETNPFAEVCGHVCDAGALCEKLCIRTEFAPAPVRVRELHRWVAEHAGSGGWGKAVSPPNGIRACVVGAGVTGLTCAHYLARLGYGVTLIDRDAEPGGGLKELVKAGALPKAVLDRELGGILLPAIEFVGNREISNPDDVRELGKKYAAVFITFKLGLDLDGSGVKGMPNVSVGGRAYSSEGEAYAVVHAVRDGRLAAVAIDAMLGKNRP
jgi:hypothetical protein